MNITKTTKLYFIIACTLLIACVGISFLIHRYISDSGAELLAQIKEVAEYTDREQKYSELSRLIAATQEDRAELDSYTLKRAETINFLAAIERVAKEKQVVLSTERLEEEVTETYFDTLFILFALEGSDVHVRDMIRIFETLPYHSSVTGVTINKKKAAEDANIHATVELLVSVSKI